MFLFISWHTFLRFVPAEEPVPNQEHTHEGQSLAKKIWHLYHPYEYFYSIT